MASRVGEWSCPARLTEAVEGEAWAEVVATETEEVAVCAAIPSAIAVASQDISPGSAQVDLGMEEGEEVVVVVDTVAVVVVVTVAAAIAPASATEAVEVAVEARGTGAAAQWDGAAAAL